ncbi:hypothetical protein [Filomicrobium sp.]|uniref:hypothetical protein n=1 Tax=Filomicrobium sp. TaxID=2024831 RepID=UPI00258C0CD0|nr:hypothetical protein [Filomicrobium sp.]MCV0371627.1 hypothetical protein [Filomicrobium sp.]
MDTVMNAGEVAQVAIIERWGWWQGALADPSKIGTEELPIHPGEYQLGYYRTRRKNGPWEPVGIYPDENGVVVGFRNGRQVEDLVDLFLWSCRNPISYEAYVKADAGEGFDDEPPAPPIGDNSGASDPFKALKLELAGEVEQLTDFMRKPVETQADADRCGIWAKRCSDLAKRINSLRETVKAPHLAKCREIDGEFKPVEAEAKEWATKAKRHVEPFLIAEKRKRDEEARKAREEAERKRQEAMKAQNEEAKAIALKAAQDAEKATEAPKASAGRTGARVSIRVEKRGEIVDQDTFYQAVRDRSEITDLLQSLANRAAKSGFDLPGMKIVEIEKAV